MTKVNKISFPCPQTSGPLAHKIILGISLILGSFVYPHFIDKPIGMADI